MRRGRLAAVMAIACVAGCAPATREPPARVGLHPTVYTVDSPRTERTVRVRGTLSVSHEAHVFQPCSLPGGPWWLEAPDAFWDALYAFAPAGSVPKLDAAPFVAVDVTARVEELDAARGLLQNWRGVPPGYGHGLIYPGRIDVLSTHAIRPTSGPGSDAPAICP